MGKGITLKKKAFKSIKDYRDKYYWDEEVYLGENEQIIVTKKYFISEKTLCEILNVSRKTFYNWHKEMTFNYIKKSSGSTRVFYDIKDIQVVLFSNLLHFYRSKGKTRKELLKDLY